MAGIKFGFIITIIVLVSTNTQAFKLLSTDGLSQCLKEVGLETKDAQKVTDSGHYNDFLSCAFKKQGVQGNDGKIFYDKIKDSLEEYYKPDEVEFVLKDCKDLTENPKDAAFLCNKCITEKILELREKKLKSLVKQ